MSKSEQLKRYVDLIQSFSQGSMSAEQFEPAYVTLFEEDPIIWDADTFAILEGLFFDVDAYFARPETLRVSGEIIGGGELRSRATGALELLMRAG